MSYATHKQLSGNRTVAIVIVALIHALLGYAIVTGLAYNVIKKAAEDLKTFDVEEEPPPPEEVPPPPDQPEVAAAGGRSAAAGPHEPCSAADGAGRSRSSAAADYADRASGAAGSAGAACDRHQGVERQRQSPGPCSALTTIRRMRSAMTNKALLGSASASVRTAVCRAAA